MNLNVVFTFLRSFSVHFGCVNHQLDKKELHFLCVNYQLVINNRLNKQLPQSMQDVSSDSSVQKTLENCCFNDIILRFLTKIWCCLISNGKLNFFMPTIASNWACDGSLIRPVLINVCPLV